MPVVISFNMVNLNSANTQVGLFIGNNNQIGWGSNGKLVMGTGQILGVGLTTGSGIFNYVDNDFIDEPILQYQIKGGNAIQGL